MNAPSYGSAAPPKTWDSVGQAVAAPYGYTSFHIIGDTVSADWISGRPILSDGGQRLNTATFQPHARQA